MLPTTAASNHGGEPSTRSCSATDAGVLAQVVVLVVVTMIGIWVSRRSKDRCSWSGCHDHRSVLRGAHAPLIPGSVPWRKEAGQSSVGSLLIEAAKWLRRSTTSGGTGAASEALIRS